MRRRRGGADVAQGVAHRTVTGQGRSPVEQSVMIEHRTGDSAVNSQLIRQPPRTQSCQSGCQQPGKH